MPRARRTYDRHELLPTIYDTINIHQEKMKLKRPKAILIGASTGGIEALAFILKDHNAKCPPILISQHILPNFCQPFADQLGKTSGRPTIILSQATDMMDGSIYIQHPETSLSFRTFGTHIRATPSNNFGASIFRPCIDDAFTAYSNLSISSSNSLAFLLTGMGNDGAKGLLELKKQGHTTISQDQNTCIVYGMPKAAKAIGAIVHEMSITSIRDNIRFL